MLRNLILKWKKIVIKKLLNVKILKSNKEKEENLPLKNSSVAIKIKILKLNKKKKPKQKSQKKLSRSPFMNLHHNLNKFLNLNRKAKESWNGSKENANNVQKYFQKKL